MLLVTGGAGYIGSHFIKEYLFEKPDMSVVILDNLTTGSKKAIEILQELFPRRVYFEYGDIRDTAFLFDVFKRYSIFAVAHFAAMLLVDESQALPAEYFDNNVTGSLCLMNVMNQAGVHNILFSSTCAVYGYPQYFPIDEQHPTHPINVYGLTKLMIEQAMQGYVLAKGWRAVVLRYFNVAGSDPDGQIGKLLTFAPHLISQCLKVAKGSGETPILRVFGTDYATVDGTCVRDYIDIIDLVQGHIKALDFITTRDTCFEIFNLGTGKGSSVFEIIATTKKITQQNIPLRIESRRPGDNEAMICDTAKSKNILGWTPTHTLEESITSAWQWVLNPLY